MTLAIGSEWSTRVAGHLVRVRVVSVRLDTITMRTGATRKRTRYQVQRVGARDAWPLPKLRTAAALHAVPAGAP